MPLLVATAPACVSEMTWSGRREDLKNLRNILSYLQSDLICHSNFMPRSASMNEAFFKHGIEQEQA
jgi:hypothetical protein